MLDLFFLGFFCAFLVLGFKRPFLWVLCYLYIDIVAPQQVSYGFFTSVPVSLIVFAAAFGGWLVLDRKSDVRFTYRQFLLILLLGYCAFTTFRADFPEAALVKWDWVWKALVFAIFLPLTLWSRLRLEAAALIMVLSVAVIIVNGGIKTVVGSGGYEALSLLVNNNSGLYESSIISCVSIAIIPVVLWLVKHGTVFPDDWRVRLYAGGLIFACCLMPIGTGARTGLVCLAVLCLLILRTAKHRVLIMGLMATVGLLALPFLPQSFTDRMSTIGDHQSDQSASTRIAVWEWTIDYVKDNPLGGGFDAYRSNRIEYNTVHTETVGSTTIVELEPVVDEARAYHSSYFELLGEQGWIGLFLWLWLQLSGLWQMEVIRRRWKGRTGDGEQWQAPLAVALQQAHIVYLVGSLFVGIGYQPFILMLVGLQCGFWSYLKRMDRKACEAAPAKFELMLPTAVG